MARTRMLKPEFFTAYELWQAEQASGLPLGKAYQGLWCQADREGRFRWEPHRLKLGILPFDNGDFTVILDALVEAGFIRKYEVDGKVYGLVPNLKDHQHFHKTEAQSKLPAPPTPPTDNDRPTVKAPLSHGGSPPDTDTDTDADAEGWSSSAPNLFAARMAWPPMYRSAFDGFLRGAKRPDAMRAELEAVASGLHPPRYDWPVIGRALHEMAVAGAQFTSNSLRGFCRKVAERMAAEGTRHMADELGVERLHRRRTDGQWECERDDGSWVVVDYGPREAA